MRIKETRSIMCLTEERHTRKADSFPPPYPQAKYRNMERPRKYLLSHRPKKASFLHSGSAVQTLCLRKYMMMARIIYPGEGWVGEGNEERQFQTQGHSPRDGTSVLGLVTP